MRTDSPSQVTLHHQAMATDFSITIACPDSRYARQGAAEAFLELDRLEDRLSAFRQDSDVSRISRLDPGATCVVDPETLHCLRVALDIEQATGGAFDIAYRSHPHRAASELIRFGDKTPTIAVLDNAMSLDLGGIGKGFALDHMAALLADWDLDCVLLRASKSTVLARNAPPEKLGWEVQFGTKASPRRLTLSSLAFSGSGSDVKGHHIIDPHSRRPATHHRLAFATAPTGAEADALSTAFVVMTDDAIRDFCRHDPRIAAYVVLADTASLQALHEPRESATKLSFQ